MGINKSLFNKHYIIKMVEEPKNAAADGEEEMPALENQEGPKLNRGEKKCRKALTKLGMKQFPGISRVTVKRRDGFIFMINDPEVLISGDDGNHFVCFGKLDSTPLLTLLALLTKTNPLPMLSRLLLLLMRPLRMRQELLQTTSTWSWITPTAHVTRLSEPFAIPTTI